MEVEAKGAGGECCKRPFNGRLVRTNTGPVRYAWPGWPPPGCWARNTGSGMAPGMLRRGGAGLSEYWATASPADTASRVCEW